MGRGLEERLGLERYRAIMNACKENVKDMAAVICGHHVIDGEKQSCQACIRAIYRANARVHARDQKGKSFDQIDVFDEIPEIQQFIEFQKANHVTLKTIRRYLLWLKRFWRWLRGDEAMNEKTRGGRPILWDEAVLQFILAKEEMEGVATYHPKQALRRLFESLHRSVHRCAL